MLPVALQKKSSILTNDFIVKFGRFKKRLLFLRSCMFFFLIIILFIASILLIRKNISAFTIFSLISLNVLSIGFCLQSKLQPLQKIPLLLPISSTIFVKFKKYSDKSLLGILPTYNGYNFLHPATLDLLNKIYTKEGALDITSLLKEVKKQSEVAAFVSNFVPIEKIITKDKIPEVLASAFVLAAYGQFSSIYPEHVLLSTIKTKSSYRFYLAALLSVFENTFKFKDKKYIITKPLLGGIKQIITTKAKIYNIKGPKFIGKTALVYLFTNFFYDKKFACKPTFINIKNKVELQKLPIWTVRPRIILIDKTFKQPDFSKVLVLKNALIFVEDGRLPPRIKKYSKTIKLFQPDLYDLYKLAIFWDLNNLFEVHYRIDELYAIVEKSQIKHLDIPQPIRLFRFLTGEFS